MTRSFVSHTRMSSCGLSSSPGPRCSFDCRRSARCCVDMKSSNACCALSITWRPGGMISSTPMLNETPTSPEYTVTVLHEPSSITFAVTGFDSMYLNDAESTSYVPGVSMKSGWLSFHARPTRPLGTRKRESVPCLMSSSSLRKIESTNCC